jgi:hypothetical protein
MVETLLKLEPSSCRQRQNCWHNRPPFKNRSKSLMRNRQCQEEEEGEQEKERAEKEVQQCIEEARRRAEEEVLEQLREESAQEAARVKATQAGGRKIGGERQGGCWCEEGGTGPCGGDGKDDVWGVDRSGDHGGRGVGRR